MSASLLLGRRARPLPSRPAGRWRPGLGAWVLLAALVFYGSPLLSLLVASVRSAPLGQAGHWTLAAWGAVAADARLGTTALNALALSALNLLVALPVAAALAALAVRSNLPGRGAVTPLMLVMFSLPSLFYALGFELLANPYTGLLNSLLGTPALNIESFTGLALVNGFRCIAFTYLFLLGPVRAMATEQEEASRVSGRGALASFWRIGLPGLTPALAGAAIFAFIGGLEVFDLALIIGVPAGIPVLAVEIFDWLNAPLPRYGEAAVVALGMVLVLGLGLWLQARMVGRRSFVSIAAKAAAPRPLALGRWRWPLAALVWSYLALAQLLPMLALLVSSFQPFPGVVGAFSTRHYQAVLASPEVRSALFNTLGLACGTGLLTSTLGLLLAQFERGLAPRAGHLLRFLAMLPLAMPGVVVALALSWAYVGVPGLRALYGSFAMMVIALVVALTPLALQIGQASLAQLSPQLYGAARVSGAAPWRAWRDTSLRLCLPGFLVGWYLALIAVCGSLDIPLLLGGPGLETLSTTIFTYNARGQLGQAAALLCLLLLLILLPAPLLAAGRPLRRWRRVRVAEDLS